MRQRLFYLSLASLIVTTLCLGLFLRWVAFAQDETKIVFLNVGEGDAILVSQGTNQVLIDSGRSGKELLARLGRHVPFWDRQIEMIIATHPDADHIGGFPALLKAYPVSQVLYSGAKSDTETSKLFWDAVERHLSEPALKIFRGASLRLPAGGEMLIEYPNAPLAEDMKDTNAGSIVIRFLYGETSFLLLGDLPREETILRDEGEVSVLKVAHHGSKYSTSAAFLECIRPKEAVISVGKNMYGHPAPEVIERLEERGVAIHRTDTEGDIIYTCHENRCTRKE